MNHSTAINELTIIRDTQLNNASVAHAEGRHDDRDRRLVKANCLSATIRELQGIREPELPGLFGVIDPAFSAQGKPRVRLVPVLQAENPDSKERVLQFFKPMWGIEETTAKDLARKKINDLVDMPIPEIRQPDIIVPGWFAPKGLQFVPAYMAESVGYDPSGYVRATAHIFLDEPATPAQP